MKAARKKEGRRKSRSRPGGARAASRTSPWHETCVEESRGLPGARILSAALFLFFFVSPLVFVSSYIDGKIFVTIYDLPKTCFIAAASLLLTALCLVYLYRCPSAAERMAAFLRRNAGFRLMLALLAWMGVATVGACLPEVAVANYGIYLVAGLFWPLLCFLLSAPARRWAAVWGLLAAYAVFTVLGLFQAFGGSLSFMIPISRYYPASTFANRNIAAQFIVFGLPFLLFAALAVRRRGRGKFRLFLPAGLLVVGIGALVLLFSNASKNGILALGVEALFLPLAWYRFRARKGPEPRSLRRFLLPAAASLAVLFLIVALTLAAPRIRARLSYSWKRFQEKGVTGVLQARYLFWRNTLVMIEDHPLAGVGPGNFRIVYPRYSRSYAWDMVSGYKKRARKAHNDYLQVAAECGIPALVVLLLLLGRQFYLLKIPEEPEAEDDDGAAGVEEWRLPLGASLAAYAVVMCFSFPLQLAYSRMFFFFLLALGEARLWRASLK